MKQFPKSLFAAALLLICFSVLSFAKELNPADEKTWMIIQPVDCLGNIWEKDWLAKHKNQVGQYPRDKEADILKAFFKKKGITILDYRTKPYIHGDPLCKTCDCPRGDTLYLLTTGRDVPKMRKFGFKDRFPDDFLDKKSTKHAGI